MILTGARVALGPADSAILDVEIRGDKIHSLRQPRTSPRARLDLRGYMLLPGLINAHDHLEFSLFPRLGQGPYPDADAWARDIQRLEAARIRKYHRVPKVARLLWGGLKNLLSGATTVCHHDAYDSAVFTRDFPVRVVRQFAWAHSLGLTRNLAERFERTPPTWPFILHAAESRDPEEIFRLGEMGVLGSRTVLVHAVGMTRKTLRLVRARGVSLVWCPSSNLFVLGRTVPPMALRSGVPVALGTDSALTAAGDLLDELRVAQGVSRVPRERLYRMVTTEAAQVLRLRNGAGSLSAGAVADVVAFPDLSQTPAAVLLSGAAPELAIIRGQVRLVSPKLNERLGQAGFEPLALEGREPVLVIAPLAILRHTTSRVLGPDIRLGGKRMM